MKKYQVECIVDNREQYYGKTPHNDIYDDCVGDYVNAESPEEAISLAIDYILENIIQNPQNGLFDAECVDNEILVYDYSDDECDEPVIAHYYKFRAMMK